MSSTAEAPSEICDDVPAVCRPSGRTDFSAGQPLQRGVAQALVGVDDAGLAGRLALLVEDRRLDRRDLALEAALVDGDARLLLRGEAERVEVLAGDAAVRGDPVGALELVGHVDVPVVGARVTEPGRTLPPSGIRDIDSTPQAMPTSMRAGGDHVVDHVGGLLARAALRVDGRCRRCAGGVRRAARRGGPCRWTARRPG